MSELDVLQVARLREQTTWLELDSQALRHNLSSIRHLTRPNASILAVVKANAYGHGLREVARVINRDVDYLGVSTIDEALVLRELEIETPILLFGIHEGEALEVAVASDVSLVVSSLEEARALSRIAKRLKKEAVIHVKVDTGMGRLGLPASSAPAHIEEIAALDGLQLEGVLTHFPLGSTEGENFTQNQLKLFNRIMGEIGRRGIHFAYQHAANSVGIANYREAHFNLVRPGLALYGICPATSIAAKLDLRPVLSWRAKIILVKDLMPGESTGYNRKFIAKRRTTIGIVPVGYSHGYPFSLSGKSHVLYQGHDYPVVGQISMDYLAVDFGSSFDGCRGDIVTLLGCEGEHQICSESLAELAGTIPYEIVTQLSPLLPRTVH